MWCRVIPRLEIEKKFSLDGVKEVKKIWQEFEQQSSNEAIFVRIIDKLEAVIQKYQSSTERWAKLTDKERAGAVGYLEKLTGLCEVDESVTGLLKEVLSEREKRMKEKNRLLRKSSVSCS